MLDAAEPHHQCRQPGQDRRDGVIEARTLLRRLGEAAMTWRTLGCRRDSAGALTSPAVNADNQVKITGLGVIGALLKAMKEHPARGGGAGGGLSRLLVAAQQRIKRAGPKASETTK